MQRIETDYLVVGAGAQGMAFVDTLIDHSDADIVMVDRRARPGGHWIDAYPFVHLHQPSSFYGVGSTHLGLDRIEATGPEAGFYERATGSEICAYFDDVMDRRLLPSGRVRYFPMCDYLGNGQFSSRLTDRVIEVTARRAVVDATYMQSRIPANEPPPFEVAAGMQCVPVGELTSVREPPEGYDIIGGGKTALDAIGWLIDQAIPPERIRWIRPRDSWLLDREFYQPGDGALRTLEGVVLQVEAVAECESVEEVFVRLEDEGVMLRTDRDQTPSMMRGATISRVELDQIQQITEIVRLGYVERVEEERIVLTQGSVPTNADRLHVHCAAPGLSDSPPIPIFGDQRITLQFVARSLPLSAAILGFVEATVPSTDEKNTLCPPNPWFHTPFDYLRSVLTGMKTEASWLTAPAVQAFVNESRLNLMHDLPQLDQERTRELQRRLAASLFPALRKIDAFAQRASPVERGRLAASL